ncbi:hypothetical protein [Shinella pollutisoli]|uniref:Uncharacterized protein n=1 Tax=Shinella pollutisoli TaxID=2250594 RepID=A0ABV7DJY6_9HYPH|nr:hypothetical protein [Shinella pollutisoli]
MLGIGLGGFMDGFQRGQQVRDRMDARSRRQALQEREDLDYNRELEQRNKIEAIGTQAQSEFDSQVQSGALSPEDFDNFWSRYTIPKLKQQYLLNGDIDSAERVQKWGDSEDAREGGRLFTSALLKAQTGDAAGALDDAMKLGKLKGYISHGYEILGQDSIVLEEGGPIVGYEIKLKGPDGKELLQSVKTENLPQLIATFGNPNSAWESQVAAEKERAKSEQELKTYRDKKLIDKEFGLGGESKQRSDAVTNLRKRMDGGLAGDETKFDDLPREEQERLIQREIELISGQPGLAAENQETLRRKVLVDTVTGRAIDPAAEASRRERAAASQAEKARKRAEAERRPPEEKRQSDVEFMLRSAEEAVLAGEPAERIERELLNEGIPVEQWPGSLRQALSEAKQKSIGLPLMR